jgi:hypothetical protein
MPMSPFWIWCQVLLAVLILASAIIAIVKLV